MEAQGVTGNACDSTLLALPAELRQHILSYALVQWKGIYLRQHKGCFSANRCWCRLLIDFDYEPLPVRLPVAETCRLLFEDSWKAYYATNTFVWELENFETVQWQGTLLTENMYENMRVNSFVGWTQAEALREAQRLEIRFEFPYCRGHGDGVQGVTPLFSESFAQAVRKVAAILESGRKLQFLRIVAVARLTQADSSAYRQSQSVAGVAVLAPLKNLAASNVPLEMVICEYPRRLPEGNLCLLRAVFAPMFGEFIRH